MVQGGGLVIQRSDCRHMKSLLLAVALALLQAPSVEPAPLDVCEGTVDTDCLHADCTRLICARQFCEVYVHHSSHVVPVPNCTPS